MSSRVSRGVEPFAKFGKRSVLIPWRSLACASAKFGRSVLWLVLPNSAGGAQSLAVLWRGRRRGGRRRRSSRFLELTTHRATEPTGHRSPPSDSSLLALAWRCQSEALIRGTELFLCCLRQGGPHVRQRGIESAHRLHIAEGGWMQDLPAHQAAAEPQEPGHDAQAGRSIPGGQKRSGAAVSSAACPLQSLDSARRVLPRTAGVPPGLCEPQSPRHARHIPCYQKWSRRMPRLGNIVAVIKSCGLRLTALRATPEKRI